MCNQLIKSLLSHQTLMKTKNQIDQTLSLKLKANWHQHLEAFKASIQTNRVWMKTNMLKFKVSE